MAADQQLTLYDLTTRPLRSPSLSISSHNSSSFSNGYKRRFDDRSTTKTSLALRSYRSKRNLRQQRNESSQVGSLFKWLELSKITTFITSLNFETTYGKVIQVKSNAIYIALSTANGKIIIFNYNQDIQFTLDGQESGDISSMAFSSDSSFLQLVSKMVQLDYGN